MSSYLGDIVQYIRNNGDASFKDRVFMGNDINAIDVAYSETENHRLSVFFVPGDTAPGNGDAGKFYETMFFKAYIFVPVEDDVAATDGWEVAINCGKMLTENLNNVHTALNRVEFLGGREFRVGRGYYIYVQSYSVDIRTYASPGKDIITYYRFMGEVDGVASYSKSIFFDCLANREYSLSRNTIGVYNSFGCELFIPWGNEMYEPTHKDFFIVQLVNGDFVTSKAVAVAAGYRVYEVNGWQDYYSNNSNREFIGRRIVGA